MQSRTDKARRLATIQRQVKLAEEWKMRDLERRLGEAAMAQQELIAALNDEHALHGLFLDTMARRLRALARDAERIGAAKDAQARRLLASAGRLKCAERFAAVANLEAQRESDKKDLLDLLDRLASA